MLRIGIQQGKTGKNHSEGPYDGLIGYSKVASGTGIQAF